MGRVRESVEPVERVCDEERVEIAYLPGGAVAMRSSLDPETVLRYTEAEWRAFVLGARDGEFDLEPAPHNGGVPADSAE